MTQCEQVVEALAKCGGYATFSELNQNVDTSTWQTLTPAATIRRIVQTHPKLFYRIVPGQWGLVSMRRKIEGAGADCRNQEYTHGYYQGLLVDIGNAEAYKTFVPAQDRNREYQHGKLGDFATLPKIYEFANSRLMRKAKTVDTIWFNAREMPHSFLRSSIPRTSRIRSTSSLNSRISILSSLLLPRKRRSADLRICLDGRGMRRFASASNFTIMKSS